MFSTLITIFSGAGLGAILRWFFGIKLNSIYPDMPLGTLSANLLGAYLIGITVAFFASNSTFSPEWRLFIITGFLGGLTTFSTFSAEVVTMLQEGRFGLGLFTVCAHVIGSLLMTVFGMATYFLLHKGTL